MQIKKHRLADDSNIEFKPTPNTGGAFASGQPDTIVLHYTAAPSLASAVNWLTNKKAKASAHVVVGRDCKIVQLADFNTVTWHAGKSQHEGRDGLNKYSIGIEIDNCGILQKINSKTYGYTANGPKYGLDEVLKSKHKNGGREEAWHKYPDEQIERVIELIEVLCKTYKIKYIVGHEDIAPGRKCDPGPAFPMQEVKNRIFGKKNVKKEEVVIPKEGVLLKETTLYKSHSTKSGELHKKVSSCSQVSILDLKEDFYKVRVSVTGYVSKKYTDFDNSDSPVDGVVNTEGLNVRASASPKAALLGEALSKGTPFHLLENSNSWILIRFEREGWIPRDLIR
ncbi:MAG: N-acetylmuramoyl-L-alanine amidase [Leptospiraceae bacterium]|nr:N-acetylmuramoyl-L-alanine amidase [Leptospiraceae bacterium]MCP5513482.1 N-acetylmuramoyl-L-alanine amidase [Leptospiraceae bacterium]